MPAEYGKSPYEQKWEQARKAHQGGGLSGKGPGDPSNSQFNFTNSAYRDQGLNDRVYRQQQGDRPLSFGTGPFNKEDAREAHEAAKTEYKRMSGPVGAIRSHLGSADPGNFQLGGERPEITAYRAHLARMGPNLSDIARSRGLAANSVDLLRNRATGQAPSIAEMQGKLQADQAMKRALSMGASAQRGQFNPAVHRQSMQQAAGTQQALAGQTALNVARERMAAEQAFNQAAMGMNQQFTGQGLSGMQVGLNAMQHGLSANQAQLAADMNYANLDAQERRFPIQMALSQKPEEDGGGFSPWGVLGGLGGGIIGGIAGGPAGAAAGANIGAGLLGGI